MIARRPRESGFSLLTLSIWLLGLAAALAVVFAILPNRSDQTRLDQTIVTVEESRHALLGFVVGNSRLPAPDSTGDGLENAAATRGALPWRAMGLPAPVVDEAFIPVQYAPYRNDGDSADLADPTNLYQPAYPDLSDISDDLTAAPFNCPADTTSPVNLLDLCVAVDNTRALAADTSQVSISPAGGAINVAYVLASGGLEDADGDGANLHLDGLNEAGLNFDDPARGRTSVYDDILRYSTFDALDRELSCLAHATSMSLLESVAEASLAIVEGAEDLQSSSEVQWGMVLFNLITGIYDIAGTIQSITGIAADIPKATAGCNVPPNVLCCPALGALVAGAVVYGVTAAVQVAALASTLEEAILGGVNNTFITNELVPRAKINMCNAINDLYEADLRGGL